MGPPEGIDAATETRLLPAAPLSNRKQVEHHSAKNTDDTLHDVEDDEIVRLQQSSEDPSVVLTNLGRYIAAEPQPFSILGANSFGAPMKSWDMVLLRSHFGSSPASHPQRHLLHRDFNTAWASPPYNALSSRTIEAASLRQRGKTSLPTKATNT